MAVTGKTVERTSESPRLHVGERLRILAAHREILANLVRKELKVKYAASALGAVWSLLNPLVYLAVFSFVAKVLGAGIASYLEEVRGKRRRLAHAIRGHGALVSEFPPEAPAQRWTFAQRDSTIAALGAADGRVVAMVVKQGMTLAAAGVVLGLAGAFGVTRLLSSLLFGVGARDPLTMSASAGILAVVAFLACYIPARRAARLDPLVALRHE